MLEALGVPAAWLPPLLESTAWSGATLAGATPWEAGVPVAAGAGDQAAAALGVGVDRPGPVAVTIGTSGGTTTGFAYVHIGTVHAPGDGSGLTIVTPQPVRGDVAFTRTGNSTVFYDKSGSAE